MNYQKQLNKYGINDADLETLVAAFEANIKSNDLNTQAKVILESAAIDMALGAVEMHTDATVAENEGLSARQWLSVLTGVAL